MQRSTRVEKFSVKKTFYKNAKTNECSWNQNNKQTCFKHHQNQFFFLPFEIKVSDFSLNHNFIFVKFKIKNEMKWYKMKSIEQEFLKMVKQIYNIPWGKKKEMEEKHVILIQKKIAFTMPTKIFALWKSRNKMCECDFIYSSRKICTKCNVFVFHCFVLWLYGKCMLQIFMYNKG